METIRRYRIPGLWEDNLRQTGGQTGRQFRPRGPDCRRYCVTGFRCFGRMGDKLADKLGDNFRPRGPDWRGRDDLGDKLADKLGDNLGPRPDWRQFCVTGFRGPGIVRGQSGRQIGGQTEAWRPDWRQFCVTGFRGPGIVRKQSGRQTGGQTEAWRPGLETILRYRIPGPRDCPRTIWATNRTNWATI